MFLLLLVFTLVFILGVVSWTRMLRDCKKFNISGPTPLPFLGNALKLLCDSAQFLLKIERLSQKYGGAFHIHVFSKPYVVITHPKYAEAIWSKMELTNKGESYKFLRPWLGDGLLTASGQRWRNHRKFLTPAFHFNVLRNYLPVFCRNVNILTQKLDSLSDRNSIEIFPLIALTALDNITESIMGVSVNAQTSNESEYVKAVDTASSIIFLRMRNPFIGEDVMFNMLPLKSQQHKALKILHVQTKKVIESRQAELRINPAVQSDLSEGTKNNYAFLDMLLMAEVDGKKLDIDTIREEVDTFMFEGHDTTTSGIVFTLYCIAKHDSVQAKILEEQKTIFGEHFDRDPSYGELSQMKYLEMVIKESLRLYPSVPLIERIAQEDADVHDLHLYKGASILISIIHMHRNPDVYENPLEFQPERFDAESQKSHFNWVPFSAGARNCIGQKFAMMEMKVILSHLVKHFKFFSTEEEPIVCADLILRSKNGVRVRLERRNTIF